MVASTNINVSVSGSAEILTKGECLGDYKVHASGSGSIIHLGSVAGRIRESKSGTTRIRIG